MKTIKLIDKKVPPVDELLEIARREAVLLVSEDGTSFILEEADDFDQEVAQFGSSEKFMEFLEERSREKGSSSIEQLIREINPQDC